MNFETLSMCFYTVAGAVVVSALIFFSLALVWYITRDLREWWTERACGLSKADFVETLSVWSRFLGDELPGISKAIDAITSEFMTGRPDMPTLLENILMDRRCEQQKTERFIVERERRAFKASRACRLVDDDNGSFTTDEGGIFNAVKEFPTFEDYQKSLKPSR